MYFHSCYCSTKWNEDSASAVIYSIYLVSDVGVAIRENCCNIFFLLQSAMKGDIICN